MHAFVFVCRSQRSTQMSSPCLCCCGGGNFCLLGIFLFFFVFERRSVISLENANSKRMTI